MKWAAILPCFLLLGCGDIERLRFVPAATIPANKKSDLPYAMKTCGQLAQLKAETYAELSARSQAHDAGDTAGSGSMGSIGDLKGQMNAITSTMAAKGCP